MVTNALHALASTAGGLIEVRTRPAGIESVALEVKDNGPGIPDQERERVFERFYRVLGTGVAEGCGLGLAIVREIALTHRADVVLTTAADGQGTVVRVTFPAAAEDGPAGVRRVAA